MDQFRFLANNQDASPTLRNKHDDTYNALLAWEATLG